MIKLILSQQKKPRSGVYVNRLQTRPNNINMEAVIFFVITSKFFIEVWKRFWERPIDKNKFSDKVPGKKTYAMVYAFL